MDDLASLPPTWGLILAAIRRAARAWATEPELAVALGRSPTRAGIALAGVRETCAAMAAGDDAWLARWDYWETADGRPAKAPWVVRAKGVPRPVARVGWTLSPLGAERLGLELLESADGGEPRWGRVGPDPGPIRLPRRPGEVRCAWLDRLAWPAREEPRPTLKDEESGEEVRLFRGKDGKGPGIPVIVDRRIGAAKRST